MCVGTYMSAYNTKAVGLRHSIHSNQIDSALCLEFTLAPSTYATMLLRELLKRSMTADEMKKMNPAPPTQSKAVEGGGVEGVKEGDDGDAGK